MTTGELSRTAYHEAGHAIIGRVFNMKCGRVSIEPQEGAIGHAVIRTNNLAVTLAYWEKLLGKRRSHRSALRAGMMVRFAGGVAEQIFFSVAGDGDRIDRERIATLAEQHNIGDHELRSLERMTRLVLTYHRDKVALLAECFSHTKR